MAGTSHIIGYCCDVGDNPCTACIGFTPALLRAKLTTDITACVGGAPLGLLNIEVDLANTPEDPCCWFGNTTVGPKTYAYVARVAGLPSRYASLFIYWGLESYFWASDDTFDGHCANLDVTLSNPWTAGHCNNEIPYVLCGLTLWFQTVKGHGGVAEVWRP